MAQPTVKFTQEDPIDINSNEHKPVHLKVKPRGKGTCTVKLAITAPTLTFEDGSKEMAIEIDSDTDDRDKEFDCTFMVKVAADHELVLRILLRATAINADGNEGTERLAGARVDCRITNPNQA
ncbi:MAG: hypothetical protein H6557_16250 [Lewinellaceae bacterium]|nr:hypothetical protein [Phaeodactylibacter sp.]MCB9038168.1 hypothetical protein [Lewinellaceae bacterium]